MRSLARYFGETRGADRATTSRVYCNKLVFPLARAVTRTPPRSWVHSPWHWYRFPFSLRNRVLWSRTLGCWFRASDEAAIECMLRLPDYEPVDWVTPKRGDVVLDVGAYVGWYTLRAARAVGASGCVVALEPDAENRRQLEANLALNGIGNVRIVGKAAWSGSGPLPWRHVDHPPWRRVSGAAEGLAVDGVALDDLTAALALPRVDWIKMDVEGAEVQALRGARALLRQFQPTLFIEVHETYAELKQTLQELHYAVAQASFDVPPERHGWVLVRPAGG